MSTQLSLADNEPRLFSADATPAAPKVKAKDAPKRPARRSPAQDRNLAAVREAKAAKAAATKRRRAAGPASWQIDDATRKTGRAGVAAAREALLAARRSQFELFDTAA